MTYRSSILSMRLKVSTAYGPLCQIYKSAEIRILGQEKPTSGQNDWNELRLCASFIGRISSAGTAWDPTAQFVADLFGFDNSEAERQHPEPTGAFAERNVNSLAECPQRKCAPEYNYRRLKLCAPSPRSTPTPGRGLRCVVLDSWRQCASAPPH